MDVSKLSTEQVGLEYEKLVGYNIIQDMLDGGYSAEQADKDGRQILADYLELLPQE